MMDSSCGVPWRHGAGVFAPVHRVQMLHRLAVVGLLVLAAAVVWSIVVGADPRRVADLRGPVFVSADDRTLSVSVPSCNGEPSALVDEGADTVTIEVTTDPSSQDDCLDGVTVQLAAPLDGRRVVDGRSGDLLQTEPAP